ncbi:hypothetical protein FPOAC2_00125 [Fusarium poae]|uniref:hypothetical protein n=1 Tax=Fusarium poae TaxID=36050 RepID=UPI001CEAC60D|nr:hypothetical protein FPOAC1_000111 [Fusarium poae]KAG8674148.1 hypothetical protein FPOAC1_000111 [Fusarium poae]
MTRLSFLAGSAALLAFSGVNAGPCRPSSSVVTTSLEPTATPTEISESTKTLESTSSLENDVTETVSVTLSTTETTSAAAETTETTNITADPTTTTAAETSTAAISTTSAAPVPQNDGSCSGLPKSYTAPDGVVFQTRCNSNAGSYVPLDTLAATSFENCIIKCTEYSICYGVEYIRPTKTCIVFFINGAFGNSNDRDVALRF